MTKDRAFSLIELSIVILIIGILIAGVTQGSRLVKQGRIKTAQNQTNSSPVPGINGLALWVETTFDTSFPSGLVDDGSSITNWYDINPGAINKISLAYAPIAGATSEPTYIAGGINNLPVIRFDGVYDCLITPAKIPVNALSQGQITIFMVAKYYGPNSGAGVIFKYQNTGANLRIGIEVNSNYIRFDFPQSVNGALLSTTTNIANQNYIFTFTENGTTQAITLNGSSTPEAVQANNLAFISSDSHMLSIGGDTQSDSAYCTGHYSQVDIGEIIVYDHMLKNSEIKDVQNYLSKKWAINLQP